MSRGLRVIIGAVLCLVLVGEPTVGIASGLYTPPGFIVLGTLYILLFLLYEALVARYNLTNLQLLLINFAVYSVLITGLLHGEFLEYIKTPENTVIITVIRIQAACFPAFVYAIMNRFKSAKGKVMSLNKVLLLFCAYVLLLSPTKVFGLVKMNETLKAAPTISFWFIVAAIIACVAASALRKKSANYPPQSLYIWSIVLLVLGAIPLLPSFIILAFLMPTVTAVYLYRERFRYATVATPK